MKYREQQIRNILKQHQTKWDQERQTLQQDIYQLENSTDLKLLTQAQEKQKELQEALDNLISLLGKEEIKNLTDLRNLLKGQTLQELITSWEKKYQILGETNTLYQQKITDLDNQLINLARQKIKNQKEAKELLNQLETNWKKNKENWQQEKADLIIKFQQKKDNQAWRLIQEKEKFNEKISQLEKSKEILQESATVLNNENEELKKELEKSNKLQKDHPKLIEKYNDLEKRSRLNSLDLGNLTREKQLWLEEKKELKEKVTKLEQETFTQLEKEFMETLSGFVFPDGESTLEARKQFVKKVDTELEKFNLYELENYPHFVFDFNTEGSKRNFFEVFPLHDIIEVIYKKETFAEQLRKINLLFDENTKENEEVDFNKLYSLLENMKRDREQN